MPEKNDVLTLSNDKDYVVVDLFTHDDKTIIVLNDLETNLDIKFGILNDDEVTPITDPDLLGEVILKVSENLDVIPKTL